MSADIVQRLRTRHANDFGWAETEALMREAAGEIERLRQGLAFEKRINPNNPAASGEIERLRHELTLMRVAENGRLVFATEEIERLRAENARLRDPGQSSERYWEGRFRDENAENERLRARVAELEIVS